MKEFLPKKLRARLLIFYLLPIAFLLLASAWFFYYKTHRSLNQETNIRLMNVTKTLASQIKPMHLEALSHYDLQGQTYLFFQKRFSDINNLNGLDHVYLLKSNLSSLVDARSDFLPGTNYVHLQVHADKIKKLKNTEVIIMDEQLFNAQDTSKNKKVCTLIKAKSKVNHAILCIEAQPYFYKGLSDLRNILSYFSILSLMIILLISYFTSKNIIRPIEYLVRRSRDMAEGVFSEPIKISADNELQVLAHAMEDMRKKVKFKDEERNMMLKGIAHEIKNPIGGMELYADILGQSIKNAPEGQQSLSKISFEIENLKKLVKEFLDFARGPVLDAAKEDINVFAEGVLEHFKKIADEKNIVFKLHKSKQSIWNFDAYYLKRVMLNVLHNAVDAIEGKPGEVIVSFEKNSEHMIIRVEDNGEGIDKHNIQKVFKPFFTSKAQGMGLGLAFCKKIIEKHGGKINIQSEYGKGTQVLIELPHVA